MKTTKCILSVFTLIFTVATHAQNWTSGINSGGSNSQTSTDVTEAPGGSKVVVGTYTRGNALFGTTTLNWLTGYPSDPFNVTPNGFIVKYSSTNSVLVATRIAASAGVTISSVTTSSNGNIYVCGTYQDICYFYHASNPNATTPAATLPAAPPIGSVINPKRGFVAKYSAAGILIWARRGIGSSEVITDIAVSDDHSQLVVTGRVHEPDSASGIIPGTYVLWLDPATGNTIRSYNYSNNWSYTDVYKTGLCIDHSNNVIVSGLLTVPSYTVAGASGGITVSSPSGGGATIYAKYNASGVLSWARATRATISSPQTQPSSLLVDQNNDIYIAGWAGSGASNYDLQFPASSTTYTTISIPTSTTENGYIVKLNSANGYASWKSFARNTTSGKEAISLANGKCNFIYACINTKSSPTYTDAFNTVVSLAVSSSQGLAIVPINTNGQLLTTTPWIANGVTSRAQISSSGSNTLQCASTASSTISLQTTGGSITLSPASGSSDIILGTITYSGPAPTVTLPDQTEICEGSSIPLNATVTGTPSFTYTWSIYNITTGNYDNFATTGSSSYSVAPWIYSPYIITLGTFRFVNFQVTVTDCSGLTSSYTQTFVLKAGISYTQVSGVDVCYNQITAPNAVFSVNAQNVDAYSWQYSADGGTTWITCSGTGYSGVNTATLTVLNPTATQNNYLFRCKLSGCPTQETNPALLTVTPCPQRPDGGDSTEKTVTNEGKTVSSSKLSLYPNPVSTSLEVVFETDISDTENTTSEAYILDMTGRKVHEISFEKGRHILEVSDLQNGTYSFVILTNGKVVDQQKFIVMH